MKDTNRILEHISDVGDTVGDGIGKFIRSLAKRGWAILVITILGILIFAWAVLAKAFNIKKESPYEF